MKRKVLSLFLASCVMFSLVAGCGSNKNSSEPKDAAKKTSDAGLKGKIEFFSQKKETVDTFNAIIKEFNKVYPDIQVEQVTVPNAQEVLITRITTGDAPDVFTMSPLSGDYKIFAKEGYMLDLTQESCIKNVNEQILNMTPYENKFYSLPIALNTTGVFYNIDIFKKLGLKIPSTHAEFIETAKAIKKSGATPIVFSDKDSWTLGAFGERTIGLFMNDKGEFFEKVAKGQDSNVNSKAMRKLAEEVLELRQYGQPDTLGTGYDQAVATFANGDAAMFYQGTWALPLIKKANPNLKFAMFPYPGETADNLKASVNIDNGVSIYANGKNLELSKKFVEFLSRTSTAQIYANMDGSPSAIKGVNSSTEELKEVQKIISEGKTFRLPGTYWANGMVGDFRDLLQKLVMDKNVDQYLKDLDKAVVKKYNTK